MASITDKSAFLDLSKLDSSMDKKVKRIGEIRDSDQFSPEKEALNRCCHSFLEVPQNPDLVPVIEKRDRLAVPLLEPSLFPKICYNSRK